MRVATYIRVSDERQRSGASLVTQLEDCRRYIERQPGWISLYELEDVESGLNTSREAYQDLLGLVRKKAIDVVVVWKLDRFGRDEGESILRCKDLARANVTLVSATEGQQSPFVQKIMFLLANEESRRLSSRVRPNMNRLATSGLWLSRPPTGYTMELERRGRLVRLEPQATRVIELFGRAAQGEGLCSLARWAQTTELSSARLFRPHMVKRILTNPVYKGQVRWNRTNQSQIDGSGFERRTEEEWVLVPGLHEPLVDEATWQQAQQILQGTWADTQPSGRRYLLTGLLRCGSCGLSLGGENKVGALYRANPQWKPQWTYKCRHRGHACRSGKGLEQAILQAVQDIPWDPHLFERAASRLEQQRPTGLFAEERQDLAEKLQRATDLVVSGVLSAEVYLEQRHKLEAQIAAIDVKDSSLATFKRESEAKVRALRLLATEFDGDFLWALEHGTLDEAHATLRRIIGHVVVYKGGSIDIHWQPFVEPLLAMRGAAQ